MADRRSLAESLREYARGVAGGLIFSLPLLYTMEVWWIGFNARPSRLLTYVVVTFVLLLGYNRYAGLRSSATWRHVAVDSVEELGLGLLVAAGMLWLLGRITSEMAADEVVGKIVIEAMTVAIGISVGTAQLGGGADDDAQDKGMDDDHKGQPTAGVKKDDQPSFGGQMTLALCGAVLFASNLAPTEEVTMIAVEASPPRLLGLTVVSLGLGALIIFYSNFTGTRQFTLSGGISEMLVGTIMTYAVALLASAAILWFFGRFDGLAPITCLAKTIVLGLAGTLGASAGRLLLQ